MNYFKYILFFFIITSTNSFGQNNKNQKKVGDYFYYSIADTVNNNNDSIRFIISGNSIKPTIFFIQGSLPDALFVSFNDTNKCFLNGLVSINDFNKFNFVVISKPNIPIILNNGQSTSENDLTAFNKCNYKDYFISTLKNVYDFTKKNKLIDTTMVFLVGHSQGYDVVSKYASIYPNDFNKITCMSSSIYNVPAIRVNQILEKMKYGIYNDVDGKNLIDSVYNNMEIVKEGIKDLNGKYYYSYKRDYSFSFETNVEFLLKINKPILVVYGLKDVGSMDNCFLPIIFKSYNKNNLTIFSYPKFNHNYFLIEYDENGNIIKNEFHWKDVMNDVCNWLIK